MAPPKKHSSPREKSASREKVDPDSPQYKYNKGTNAKRFSQLSEHWLLKPRPDSERVYYFWNLIVTTLAFALRFYKIWYPREVVFDEVHFGKFASYYIQRSFFFDVHPPFAKMMIAFIGWIFGYDGTFKFDEIGMSYETHPAPFLAYRGFNAILGTLTIPVMFNTLKELNFKALTCAFGALIVAIDDAHVTETRLILLDAILIFSVACTFYCYVRFYKAQLKAPFSLQWHLWLHLTGLSLSFVISTKYVGVMTYGAIGIAVIVNLWQLLDIRAGLSIRVWMRHFSRRLNGLVLIPFVVYLFWFWVHFAVLNTSGPGDSFMSAAFQETLHDSSATINSRAVHYYDIITLKHKDTDAWLHSNQAHYPLRYEDGRISSQGQVVTCLPNEEDIGNQWEVLPPLGVTKQRGDSVLLSENIRLRHIATNTYLKTHDVASPMYPTNEEVTTVSEEKANNEDYQQTLWQFQALKKTDEGHVVKSQTVNFRIFHVNTQVALWSHNDVLLPSWAKGQQEVNGSKKLTSVENNFIVDKILNLDESRKKYVPKVIKHVPFLSKWFELQKAMFVQNSKLSADHPFASQPETWPVAIKGVSFWTKAAERRQIYFHGNVVGFWFEFISIFVFLGLIIGDLVTRQRNFFVLNGLTREKLYGPVSYFLVGWACHYFPFFLMARQKFLHHYLPAHLIAALFSAALWETIFTDFKSRDPERSEDDAATSETPVVYISLLAIFYLVVATGMIAFFVYFSPLVYGTPMTPAEVRGRQWFNIVLNYSK